jgi:hypothetical protein
MYRKLITIASYAALAGAGYFVALKIFNVPRQIEAVVIFAIALFYPIAKNPLLGMYAFFITLPFITLIRRLYYLLYGRPAMDPLLMAGEFLILTMMVGLFFELRLRRDKDEDIRFYKTMVLIYFAYLVFRVFVYNDCGLELAVARFKFYGPAVLLFFIGIIYAPRVSHLKSLWAITAIIGVITALYGFKQLYWGFSRAENIWLSSIDFSTLYIKDIIRPFSTFQSPAAFADYMVLSVIGLLMFWSWKKGALRIAILLLVPVFFYAVLITSVRSDWIGFIAVLLFWFTFSKVKGMKQRVWTLVAIGVCYVLISFAADTLGSGMGVDQLSDLSNTRSDHQRYMQALVTNRAAAITDPLEEHSMLSRVAVWRHLFAYSVDPLLMLVGRGVGAFNADSLYVTYLAEFGYPGFFFIIFLLGSLIYKGMKIMDSVRNPDLSALARGITVFNLAFAIISITGSHLHSFPGDAFFWFFNGVMIKLPAVDKLLEQEAQTEVFPDKKLRVRGMR